MSRHRRSASLLPTTSAVRLPSAVSTALSPAGPIPVPTEPIVALKSTSVIRRGSSSDAAARVSWPCGSVSRLAPAARSIEKREGIVTEEREVQLKKAELPMEVTEEGIVTCPFESGVM